jgi:prophage regulatory protein
MRLLRIKEVMQITGLSRMTLYRMERVGHFPRRRQLGAHSVAWLEGDVSLWVQSRPVGLPQGPELTATAAPLRINRRLNGPLR